VSENTRSKSKEIQNPYSSELGAKCREENEQIRVQLNSLTMFVLTGENYGDYVVLPFRKKSLSVPSHVPLAREVSVSRVRECQSIYS